MCELIQTGQFAAIKLKTVRSAEILKLDDLATKTVEENGGYANFVLKLWRKVFTMVVRSDETHVLHKKNIPNA